MKLEINNNYNTENLNAVFIHCSIMLDTETLIIVTSDEDDVYEYSLIVLSHGTVKKIFLSHIIDSEHKHNPVLINIDKGFGILTEQSKLYYYETIDSSPTLIQLNNAVLPESAQLRFSKTPSNTEIVPVLFEDTYYYHDARYYGLLDLKSKKWIAFYHLNTKDFPFHTNNGFPPKIDSLKIYNNDFFAFTSGGKTTSVNKWGMDYYGLIRINENGTLIDSYIASENLEASQKKQGVHAKFTYSEYVILEQLFKNDSWKGKQKLFSLKTKEYSIPQLPRGFSKYKIEQINNEYIWAYTTEKCTIKNIIRCKMIHN